MAARFWVGGTGTWDATSTTHWATTSGGSSGASVPGSSDTVTFDANSGGGTVTVNTTVNVVSITAGSFTSGTLDFSANNNNVTAQTISITGTVARNIKMGNGTWTITGTTGTIWNSATITNLTFNANNSSLVFSSNATFTVAFGGLTLHNVSFTAGGTLTITGLNTTFNNLTISCSGTDKSVNVSQDITINGTFTITATTSGSTSGRINICGGSIPTGGSNVVTITAAAVSLTNVNFNGIEAAGAAAPWTGTGIGNGLGCSNITFSPARTLYWVGNGGNWNNTNRWALSSGGTAGNDCPFAHDLVIFDENSITSAGQTINAGVNRFLGKNLDFSEVLNSPIFTIGGFNPCGTGNLTWGAGMTTNNSTTVTLSLLTEEDSAVLFNGITMTINLAMSVILGTSGSYSFLSDIVLGTFNRLTYNGSGTLNANDHNVNCGVFACALSNTRTVNMGSGTWTLTGNNTQNPSSVIWDFGTGANLTLNAGASTIKVTDITSNTVSFFGAGKSFHNIWFSRSASTGDIIITGANTFHDFKDTGTAAHTITFPNSTTTIDDFSVSGSSGNVITLQRTGSSGTFTLSQASGYVQSDYLSISNSTATGGAVWFAGANSTDGGGNSGWSFASSTTSSSTTTTITTTSSSTTTTVTTTSSSTSSSTSITTSSSTTTTSSSTSSSTSSTTTITTTSSSTTSTTTLSSSTSVTRDLANKRHYEPAAHERRRFWWRYRLWSA